MRYWLTHGDGQTLGPYDLETLRGYASSGQLRPQSMVCAEGGNQWVPAASVVGNMQVPPTFPSPMAAGGYTPIGLVGPILVTVFCCLVGGIVSIVYASQAQTRFAQGDLAGSMQASKTAKTWMIVSMIIGIVVSVLWFGLAILGAMAENSQY
jgi:hypothetical protein